jgi:glycosyltransferase involved in cell wall biosynthesis
MSKKAVIFNPYWDTLGGGEKYVATAVAAMEQAGYTTKILWSDKNLVEKIQERFGIKLQAGVDPAGFATLAQAKWWTKRQYLQQFELVFWVSDGSLPFLFGKKNLLHFQVPFTRINLSWIDELKKKTVNEVICNSRFTKEVIDRTYRLKSRVIYPPATLIEPQQKRPYILAVGRFDGLMHNKRQDVLINAFLRLKLDGWELVLAGGDAGLTDYLASLKQMAENYPVRFEVNPGFEQLKKLYAEASLFWHAAGYEVDEIKEPEKVEHFGISTVEAMSAKAVPLVFKAGGQREIVESGRNGFLWQTTEELMELTVKLINDEGLRENMAKAALETSSQFSEKRFIDEFKSICLN